MTKLLKIIAVSTVVLHMAPCTYKEHGFSVLPNQWISSLTGILPF